MMTMKVIERQEKNKRMVKEREKVMTVKEN